MYVDENFSNYGNYDGFVLSMHFPLIVKTIEISNSVSNSRISFIRELRISIFDFYILLRIRIFIL